MPFSIWIVFAILILAPAAALHKSRRLDWHALLLLICVLVLLAHG